MQSNSNYVSVLLVNLLQPIFDLFELLEQSDPKGPNEVQAAMLENGYAVSVIVLSALVVESALNRTRYVRNEPKRESAVDTLKRLSAGDLAHEIEEVFVLRDIIAHNHIWTAAMRWNDSSGMALDSAEKLSAYATTSLIASSIREHVRPVACIWMPFQLAFTVRQQPQFSRRLSKPSNFWRGLTADMFTSASLGMLQEATSLFRSTNGSTAYDTPRPPRPIANEKTTRRHFGIRPHVGAYSRILLRRLDSLGFSGCDSFYVRTSQPRKRWLVLGKGTLTPSTKTK